MIRMGERVVAVSRRVPRANHLSLPFAILPGITIESTATSLWLVLCLYQKTESPTWQPRPTVETLVLSVSVSLAIRVSGAPLHVALFFVSLPLFLLLRVWPVLGSEPSWPCRPELVPIGTVLDELLRRCPSLPLHR